MKLLVLGGTMFLGRHVVTEALAKGHEVTIFHRGQHGADLFPDIERSDASLAAAGGREGQPDSQPSRVGTGRGARGGRAEQVAHAPVERVLGDRDGGLDPLAGRSFDAIVDTCGYVPRIVRAAAEFFADATDHYAFVSSLSVYADDSEPGQDESGPIVTLDDPSVEEVTGETYGALKALCEAAVTDVFGDRALNLRPGLIVGPHDPTDRFTYWPSRVARGGRILAPAPESGPVEFTDVRDLAAFLVHAGENATGGVMNATGPSLARPTFGEFLAACREVAGSDAQFAWVDESFLETNEINPWMDLPLFAGTDVPGFNTRDTGAAVTAGLSFRPMEETIRDTLEWARSRPEDHEWRAGLTADREAEALGRLA